MIKNARHFYFCNIDDVRPFLADKLVDHLGPPVGKGILKIILPDEATGGPVQFGIDWIRLPRGGGVLEHHHKTDGTRDVYYVLKGSIKFRVGKDDKEDEYEEYVLDTGSIVFFDQKVMHGFEVVSPEAEYLAIGIPERNHPRTGDILKVMADAGIRIDDEGNMTFSELIRPTGHPDRK